jgi:hypothetical protein
MFDWCSVVINSRRRDCRSQILSGRTALVVWAHGIDVSLREKGKPLLAYGHLENFGASASTYFCSQRLHHNRIFRKNRSELVSNLPLTG